MPSYTAPSFSSFGRNEYLRSTRGHIFEHYTVAASTVAADVNGNKVLQTGTVLSKITSGADSGKVGPFAPAASDGRQTVGNIVGINDSFYPYQLARGDREVAVLKHGRIVGANCYEYDSVSAPAGLAVANTGAAGAVTYRYIITSVNGVGESTGSTEVTNTTSNATLNGTNYNTVTWTASTANGVTGYKLYRTAAGGGTNTETLIANISGATTASFLDQSNTYAAGAAVPTVNTTTLGPGTRGLSSTTISALVAGNGQNDLSLLVV